MATIAGPASAEAGEAMARIAAERPPSGTLRVEVSDAQVASFREEGFLALERITTDEEIAWLGRAYDALVAGRREWVDVARPYFARGEDTLGQILFPEQWLPALRDALFFRNARRVAARLLGVAEESLQSWGHAILKPARRGHPTPWHQDEAYWEPDFDYCALGAWLPLEDVDGRNGCMRFLPGSHRGEVLPHRHVGGDAAVHLLEIDRALDATRAVEVPLRAGGATFHHQRTLHGTAGNATDRPRRVFATEFQTAPRPRAERAHRPWVDEGKRALAERLRSAPPRS